MYSIPYTSQIHNFREKQVLSVVVKHSGNFQFMLSTVNMDFVTEEEALNGLGEMGLLYRQVYSNPFLLFIAYLYLSS